MQGLILAGGYGSRFFPVTKTVPKEMLPLIDTPAIHFIVQEMVYSGIKDILIISSRRKKSLEDYFDREVELERYVKDLRKRDRLDFMSEWECNIFFMRQFSMAGTGDAVLLAESFFKEPFILAFPDDIIFSKKPLSKQLIDCYERKKHSILAVEDFSGRDVSSYGVIEVDKGLDLPKEMMVKGIIEKPLKGNEPSHYVSIGRYLLTPDIFFYLKEEGKRSGEGGEFYLTVALNRLAEEGKLGGLDFEGEHFDIGQPMGYLKAIHGYALKRNDLREEYLNFLKDKRED